MKGTTAWILSMAYAKHHGGGGGTNDYTDLENKPKINGVSLVGDLSTEDLSIDAEELTSAQMEALAAIL